MKFSSDEFDEVIKRHFELPADARVLSTMLRRTGEIAGTDIDDPALERSLGENVSIVYKFDVNGQTIERLLPLDQVRELHQDLFARKPK